MKILSLLASVTLLIAAAPPPPPLAPSEIVAAAPKSDWVAIAAHDLMVMTLAPGAKGPDSKNKARRVVIQLMPAPFSQGWVGNIRTLAAANWWDGTSINRVQDNYVVQWGDANGEDKVKAKPLPEDLAKVPQSDYLVASSPAIDQAWEQQLEYLQSFKAIMSRLEDPYASYAAPMLGWPLAGKGELAPVHCYGMVGVGRDLPPDTGTGAELYAVIGHAPRHLDRNIALVGRVIEGIEHLSSLPRGTGALGFYETPEERVAIESIRIASSLPAADQPRFEYLSTESTSFAAYADARANRRDAFFIEPAGGADICNIPVPVRRVKE